MRVRGRAAVTALILSAAVAFGRPPMTDAYAKEEKDKYAKIDARIAEVKYIPPKDYKLSFLQPLMKRGVENTAEIFDYGEGKQSFRLNTKKIKTEKGNRVWLKIRISKWEHKTGVVVNRGVKNGKYVCTVFFTELKKRLKKKGKSLKYVAVGIDRKDDEKGNAKKHDYYVVPVDSFEDAKKGNIKAGVPMIVINCDSKGDCKARTGWNIHNVVE